MMRRSVPSFLLVALLLSSAACVTDPAVRLAKCMRSGAKHLAARAESALVQDCRLGVAGRFTVVLHPEQSLTEDELVAAGLPVELVGALRAIEDRGMQGATIYVFPEDGYRFPTTTTSQKRSVSIPKVLALRTDGTRVELVLRRTDRGVEVIDIR